MDQPGTILLTSTGLSSKSVYEKFVEIKDSRGLKKAIIITTASTEKEGNQYSQLALSQLKLTGFETVNFYDFENQGPGDFSSYDTIYVCGGNTFKLMKFARQVSFDKDIRLLLEKGGVYIGVSAGSLIVGPSIKIANEIHADKNEVCLTDFSGFNIVDLIIFPHYSSDLEEEIKSFENRNKTAVERINNSQAIVIENGKKTVI